MGNPPIRAHQVGVEVHPAMTSEGATIAVACDHGGYELKTMLMRDLEDKGYTVLDLGTDSEESVDYPEFGYAMAEAIRDGKAEAGLLLCGSGIGVGMAANRYPDIRAAVVHDALGARLSRQHNNANVLCMGGRLIGPEVARDCLDIFLATEFEGGRHARRVEKLSKPR